MNGPEPFPNVGVNGMLQDRGHRIEELERQLDRLERRDRNWWWIGGLIGAASGGLAWLVLEVIT